MVIINEEDLFFCKFHHYIVMAIDSVMESFFSNENLMADSDANLTRWSKCHFLGNETFIEVKSRLSGFVHDLVDYMSFISIIPMMEHFIHFRFVGGEINLAALFFFMSLESFVKYNKEYFVYIDLDVVMCAYIRDSIPVCKRCQDNSKNLESFTQHTNDCPYLKFIFPELKDDAVDVAEPFGAVDSIQQIDALLDGDLVEQMYQKAWEATTNGDFVVPSISEANMSMGSPSKEERYMLAEFKSSTNGHIFTKWLSRLEALKV